jgi:hypothetical protein
MQSERLDPEELTFITWNINVLEYMYYRHLEGIKYVIL